MGQRRGPEQGPGGSAPDSAVDQVRRAKSAEEKETTAGRPCGRIGGGPAGNGERKERDTGQTAESGARQRRSEEQAREERRARDQDDSRRDLEPRGDLQQRIQL